MEAKHHWGLAVIQIAFSVFVVVETWLVPIEGWLVDCSGPRPVIAVGAILAALGWIVTAYVDGLIERTGAPGTWGSNCPGAAWGSSARDAASSGVPVALTVALRLLRRSAGFFSRGALRRHLRLMALAEFAEKEADASRAFSFSSLNGTFSEIPSIGSWAGGHDKAGRRRGDGTRRGGFAGEFMAQ